MDVLYTVLIVLIFVAIVVVCVKKQEKIIKEKIEEQKLEQEIIDQKEYEKQERLKRAKREEKIKKHEIEKDKRKVDYIKIMLDKPEVLRLYVKILKHKNYIAEKLKIYSEDAFKILFWDFLLGKVNKGNFELYKSKFLSDYFENEEKIYMEEHGVSKLLDEDYNSEALDDLRIRNYYPKYNEVTILNNYLHQGRIEKIDNYGRLYYSFTSIFGYVKLIEYLINFYNIVDEFENNKDLFQIYNNMKKEKISNKNILNKIYSLYENLYIDNFSKKLKKHHIELIIGLENRKKLYKKYSRNIYPIITSKLELTQFIIDELSDQSEDEMIICIVNILKNQENMDKNLKIDIVTDLDNILNEAQKQILINKKQRLLQDRKENAKKERDRLLKGDFLKESEKKARTNRRKT